jgi:hypothetical protein
MEHQANSPVKSTELVQALGEWGSEKALANGGENGRGGKGERGDRSGGKGSNNGTLPPHLLLSYKQFPRHPAATAANGASEVELASGAGDAGGREKGESSMLSAEDKINELSRMVDAHLLDRQRLGRELEEVQAEKVSMEYLLREKLERLVQSEIESRLLAYRRDGKESSLLTVTS